MLFQNNKKQAIKPTENWGRVTDFGSQWLHGLMRGSVAARLLGLRVRIPLWLRICLSIVIAVCCQVEVSVRRADHSFRGVPPTVGCLSEIVKPRE